MEVLSVPIIAVLVYGIVELIKIAIKKNEKVMTFLPIIAGGIGMVFGIIAFYATPMLLPTTNVFHAILVGLLSGLSATGSNQLIKQITDMTKNNKSDE